MPSEEYTQRKGFYGKVDGLDKEDFAKVMRRKPTPAESKLHNALVDLMADTLTIPIHQYIVGPYIVDFKVKNLLIEIDGSSHLLTKDYDQRRTSYITNKGYSIVRFDNVDVYKDPKACALHIRKLTEPHQQKHSDEIPITICPPSRSFYRPDKVNPRAIPLLWTVGFGGKRKLT